MQPNWDFIAPRTWSYPRIVVHTATIVCVTRWQPKEPLEGFHTKVLYVDWEHPQDAEDDRAMCRRKILK